MSDRLQNHEEKNKKTKPIAKKKKKLTEEDRINLYEITDDEIFI